MYIIWINAIKSYHHSTDCSCPCHVMIFESINHLIINFKLTVCWAIYIFSFKGTKLGYKLGAYLSIRKMLKKEFDYQMIVQKPKCDTRAHFLNNYIFFVKYFKTFWSANITFKVISFDNDNIFSHNKLIKNRQSL